MKTKLRQAGVRIVSYLEHFDANPMGEFLEHVMAAQAELYSPNLSMEAKKGMEERLRRGRWSRVTASTSPEGGDATGDPGDLYPRSCTTKLAP